MEEIAASASVSISTCLRLFTTRHTYCSIMERKGMNPKTLQYLMGHSDISVTMNTYTHLGLDDACEELHRMGEIESARAEQERVDGETPDEGSIMAI